MNGETYRVTVKVQPEYSVIRKYVYLSMYCSSTKTKEICNRCEVPKWIDDHKHKCDDDKEFQNTTYLLEQAIYNRMYPYADGVRRSTEKESKEPLHSSERQKEEQ